MRKSKHKHRKLSGKEIHEWQKKGEHAMYSLVYHVTVHGKVSLLNTINFVETSSLLTEACMHYMPVTMVKGKWVGSRKRARKIINDLGIYSVTPTFQEFISKAEPAISKKIESLIVLSQRKEEGMVVKLERPSKVGLGIDSKYVPKRISAVDVQLFEHNLNFKKDNSILYTAGWCSDGAFTKE